MVTSYCKQNMSMLLLHATIHACWCRGFKALKQVVKIHFKLGNHEDMLKAYK